MDTRLEEAILRDASSWSGERCEAMRDWHANGRLTEEA